MLGWLLLSRDVDFGVHYDGGRPRCRQQARDRIFVSVYALFFNGAEAETRTSRVKALFFSCYHAFKSYILDNNVGDVIFGMIIARETWDCVVNLGLCCNSAPR